MNPLTWYSAPSKVITIYNRINGDRIATVHKEEAIPLIAAAPDLLAALEDVVGWCRGNAQILPLKIIEQANAAIAKAKCKG